MNCFMAYDLIMETVIAIIVNKEEERIMEDLHSVRYMFEHRILPGWFFDEGKQLVGMLLHDKSILFELIDDIFTKEGVENPYKKEDFDVDAAKITDEVMMLKIIFSRA